MTDKYFKVRMQSVEVSRRIVIVIANDRQEAETKALTAANKGKMDFSRSLPEFAVLESKAISKSLVTAPDDQIIK